MRTNVCYIYSLSDPDTLECRYIGKTIRPKERFRKHLTAKDSSYKSKWIRSLLAAGKQPVVEYLSVVAENNSNEVEKNYIKIARLNGVRLTNITSGGDGGNTMGGRKFTKEHCIRISNGKKGVKRSDMTRTNAIYKSKKVAQIDPDSGNVINVFPSVAEAHRQTGFSKTNISKFASGKIKPTIKRVGGYHWKYV